MTSALARTFALGEIPVLDPRVWRDRVDGALRAGERPLTMFGRPSRDRGDGSVLVTAVLEGDAGAFTVLRTAMDPTVGYASFTPDFPAMHCFERELHEQHGLRVDDHPWLKPLRFERSGWAGRDAYPYYAIDGKQVHEVAVGPVHAGVIEPGSFRFACLGEQVHHLEIVLGYQHRGVERLLLARDPRKLAPLVETIAGDSSVAHAWAYAAAIEALAGIELERDVRAARGVLLELERVAMHLSGLSGMANDIGFLQGATTYGRLRTTVINTTMRLSGSRFGRGAVRPASLGARLAVERAADGASSHERAADGALLFSQAELEQNVQLVTNDLTLIDACFLGARTVRHRLQGVGVVSPETARSIGLVGLAARASGIARDVRRLSGSVDREGPIEVHTEPSGDCWARARMRIEELRRSLAWIRTVSRAHARWEPVLRPVGVLAPSHLAIGVVEGWRGEIVHALETDASGGLVHYKVQDPSLRNWLGLALAVRGEGISDFPICNKSFDLSYCGHDL